MSNRARQAPYSERLFDYLLRLYPGSFRDEYAAEMRAALRYRWRDEAVARGTPGLIVFGLVLLWDTCWTASKEHADMLMQDLKYALRILARSPLFAMAAVLTIGLGVGLNTAIFSIVDHVLLRPLPFPQSDRLVTVRLPHPTEQDIPLSTADFLDWRAQDRAVEQLAAFTNRLYTLSGAGEPVMIGGAQVTDEFFSTLGVQAFLGRTFTRGDDGPGHAPTVILSYELWRTRFQDDRDVVGRTIFLDAQPYTILGVMAADVVFPSRQQLLWVMQPIALPSQRGPYVLTGIARMKEGMTAPATAAVMSASIYPTFGGAREHDARPLQFSVQRLRDTVAGGSRESLLMLFGAGTFVLLIACVNVANLLLGKSSAREREIALRISLGANTRRLVRQFLTESLVIAALGAAVALIVAVSALRFYNVADVGPIPQLGPVRADSRMLWFALVSVVASGVLFGLAPTKYAIRLHVSDVLRSGRTTTGGARVQRARTFLILAEVTLSCVLVVGAGLLIRSYLQLSNVESGARVDHLVTFRLSPPARRYPPPTAIAQFYARLLDRIRQIPGVASAGAGSALPPDRLAFSDAYTVEDSSPAPRGPLPVAPVVIVTPEYFRAIGLPILKGRDFTGHDTSDRPAVAIISHAMAQRHFPGGDPIGRKIRQGGDDRQNPWMEIVGVAADAKYTGLEALDRGAFYKPEAQAFMSSMNIAVRTNVDPESIVPLLRSAVGSVDKDLALDQVQTMEQTLAASIARPRVRMTLLTLLSLFGLVLAGIGVYGVVAYSVARRTSELGIRAALGARRIELLWLVIREGMRPVVAGLVLGAAIALAVARVARTLLFGIEPQDPLALFAGVSVLGAVGLLACVLPALRALRIDPATALRSE